MSLKAWRNSVIAGIITWAVVLAFLAARFGHE